MADFYDPEFLQKFFMEMDGDERREAIDDWLSDVAEPWQGNTDTDAVARSIVASTRMLMEPAFTTDFKNVNQYVMGLWMAQSQHCMRAFQTLAGLSHIKKSLDEKKNDD